MFKTIKYRMYPSKNQKDTLYKWISLCKETYNLMLEQHKAAEKYNNEQYFVRNPDKKQKEEEYLLKKAQETEKLIAEGRIKPKKIKPKIIPKIIQRHPELANINSDILTHVFGYDKIENIPEFKLKETKLDKPKNLRISWQSQSNILTRLKQVCPEFYQVPANIMVQVTIPVDRAWKDYISNLINFRKSLGGQNKNNKMPMPPKFITYRDNFTMTHAYGSGFKIKHDINSGYARIFGFPKIKEGIKVRYHTPIIGEVRQQSIVLENGEFYLCVVEKSPIVSLPKLENKIGIDLGVSRSVQFSNGEYLSLPIGLLKDLEKRKGNLQRGLKRKKECSKNYYKLQKRITKIDKRIARIRKYYINMFATEIIKKYDSVAIEDLSVKNMTKSASKSIEEPGKNVKQKSGLNRSILRVAPYMMRLALQNKAIEFGKTLITVPPQYTSLTCSSCGNISKGKESRKTQDTFICIKCGIKMNADHNAAINILRKGDCDGRTVIIDNGQVSANFNRKKKNNGSQKLSGGSGKKRENSEHSN